MLIKELLEKEKKINAIVPKNDFDALYSWGYELLPPLKVYTTQKWFYKGINSTSDRARLNCKIREYCMAMYTEGRFDEYHMRKDYFLQNMVKKYWKHWWLWKGCVNLTQEEAQLRWAKECAHRRNIQDNYIENVEKLFKELKGKWRGESVLMDVKKRRGHPEKNVPNRIKNKTLQR